MEVLGLNLFGGCYANRRVLVTGHTGFKGSWLALWLGSMGAEVAGLGLDPDSEWAHWNFLGLHLTNDFRTDLRDPEGVRAAIKAFDPHVVFHLAAQPLVRRGYRDPKGTFDTNVGGLVNLFEALRAAPSLKAIVNATTDKVYENRSNPAPYLEGDSLGGHDPYSVSKACAELVSSCYRRSYFDSRSHGDRVLVATARAGNVIGGGDWAEDRLVPDLVRAASASEPMTIRNPGATRPWQHVLEPLSGYLRLGQFLLQGRASGGAWNFGPAPDAPLAVSDVVDHLRKFWPAIEVRIEDGPQPAEASYLALDSTKARRQLGWEPVWDTDTAIRRTASWYRAFLGDRTLLSSDDLEAYIAAAESTRLGWAR